MVRPGGPPVRVFALIYRNMLRHRLRTLLTIFGISVAVMAYGLIRTVISAWYVGIEATSPDRLITRHAVSFIFPLPYAYRERIETTPGVLTVSHATWFQGVYIDESNFFPRMAVDAKTLFTVYPEYLIPDEQLDAFIKQRNSCVIGIKIAKKYNLRIGDMMAVDGDIYPGRYEFVVKGMYRGREKSVDETQMFFHWEYLDERLKRDFPGRDGQIGWYIVHIRNPEDAPRISEAVDALFRNSPAESKTETEKAFAQGFISMSSAIISAMEFISYVIIGIILLVLANTMVMTARERQVEYAVLKTLGFRTFHITGLIAGESILISALGGCIGMAITFPIAAGIGSQLSTMFPVFLVTPETLATSMSFALFIGIAASLFPIYRAMNTTIVEGLRHIG